MEQGAWSRKQGVRFRFIPILGFLLLASCSWVLHAETRQQVALLKVERSTPAADRQGLTRKKTANSKLRVANNKFVFFDSLFAIRYSLSLADRHHNRAGREKHEQHFARAGRALCNAHNVV